MDPNFARGHWYLGMPYEQKAMYRAAIAEFQRRSNSPEVTRTYWDLWGMPMPWRATGVKALQAVADLRELSKRRYVAPFDTALIYTGLGDKEHAFRWLEKAFEDRSGGMVLLKVDPRFDRLRADPRFANLLRRMGLEP